MKIRNAGLETPNGAATPKIFFVFRITFHAEISGIFFSDTIIEYQISRLSFIGIKRFQIPPIEAYFLCYSKMVITFGKKL